MAAIRMFTVVKNLQGTTGEELVNGFEYEVFKFFFLQFLIFQ